MTLYKKFLRKLFFNYIIGSVLAVFGVGASFLFATLDLKAKDGGFILLIIFSSVFCMAIAEGVSFRKHLNPIRAASAQSFGNHEQNRSALLQLYRFPLLTVQRIMLPHFLGFSIPAMLITLFIMSEGYFSLPPVYVLYALLASFLVASMHALVEYYLTLKAIQPISVYLKEILQGNGYSVSLPDEGRVSLNIKFRFTILLMGIFPIILFLLAGQVKLEGLTGNDLSVYWNWAAVILIITIIYALLTSRFLTSDIEKPIYEMLQMMKEAEKQKYEFLKTDVYTDEFSDLFNGFNNMIKEIRKREHENNLLLESYLTVLSEALDARDPYTAGHSQRVAGFSKEIGLAMKLTEDELDLLNRTALLHDIGKIGVPDRVLLKDGMLTDEEFDLIKEHPVIGERILKQVEPENRMHQILPGVRSHHERMDGRGYPDGLQGNSIPLFGRIIAVADAFDAMTSDRPYRKGMDYGKALAILEGGKGVQWDMEIVNVFLEIKRKYIN